MTYDFKQQLTKGEKGEKNLDAFFAERYEIEPVSMDLQRQGIDRIFTNRETGKRHKVEYKTDWTASKTGNAFVETISVDTADKPGWAYSSKADILIYYLPQDMLVYVVEFPILRRLLPRWETTCVSRKIPNNGYMTHGLLVPLDEFERHALTVISI